jgi:hypothetical protein
MEWLHRLSSLFSNLFRQKPLDRELDGDVDGYLQMVVEENMAAGLDAAEARRQAMLEMGGLTQVKELTREARAGSLLSPSFRICAMRCASCGRSARLLSSRCSASA